MPWQLLSPKTANELCEQLLHYSGDGKYACRGQGQVWNRLTTSFDRMLERNPKLTETQCATFEAQSMKVFHDQAPTYLDQAEHMHMSWQMGTLLLMQHYGAPTRLLDWTRSPWVATYFCVVHDPDKAAKSGSSITMSSRD